MTIERMENKTTTGGILATIGSILIVLAPIIFLYGIIAFEIAVNISYKNNTNIELVLFVIEHQTLLSTLFIVALVFCVAFGVVYSQATNQMPWFLLPVILIALSLDVFAYKTPYIKLQEQENRIIQDLIDQGKITEESLKAGFFEEYIKLPAELAVCFDKEFKGELCGILFDKLLAEERIKIEARNETRKTAQATKEKQENKLMENYNQILRQIK